MKSRTPHILYEDKEIIVCQKPHGLATQSRRPGTPDLEHILLCHLAEQARSESKSSSGNKASFGNKPPYLAVIHRLDQPVAGILVFAKTPAAARSLNHQLQQEGFGKHYLALVHGKPAAPEGTLEDYMVKDGRTNTSRICSKDTPGAKSARLHYRLASAELQSHMNSIHACTVHGPKDDTNDDTWLEVILDTGRHHQIRVQLANMGCPIVGDTKYNPACRTGNDHKPLMLIAYKLSFRHPKTGKEMEFQI